MISVRAFVPLTLAAAPLTPMVVVASAPLVAALGVMLVALAGGTI